MKSSEQYKATLEFMFRQLPMFQRIGAAAFKKDLTNTIALTDFLEKPHLRFPSIHIAGTNGKGSVAYMLAAVLQAAGYKTGLYISPHYKDFRERIRINGKYVPQQFIVDFIERVKPVLTTLQPSFFELSVAMAFSYFAEEKVDIAVIETGMGGRLDSTNIVTPILSIITNISYDHTQFLGNTLEAIAGEKAGIIKPNIPVVIGESQDETKKVFLQKAKECQAPIYFADQHFRAVWTSETASHSLFNATKEAKQIEPYEVNLHGEYQTRNLQTVLQSVSILNTTNIVSIDEVAIRKGLYELKALTRFIGRWQIIGYQPMIICDSAHNEGGLQWVFRQLNRISYQKLHIVTGMVVDKDPDLVLPLFPKNARYYFAKANIPRGMDARNLQQLAKDYQLHGRAYKSVSLALRAARRHADPQDLILVVGSVFIVAEVL